MHLFSRSELLIGPEGLEKLKKSAVVVFGAGGVGSFAIEALGRAGIGSLVLVDFDEVCLTNINRQLGALHSTIGLPKVDVLRERLLDINPQIEVRIYREFVTPDNVADFIPAHCSYVVDAIDNVTGKLAIIETAFEKDIPVISAMGAGNRLDPSRLQVADISATTGCPLARVMRRELKKRGLEKGLKVVFSTELSLKPQKSAEDCAGDCISPSGDAHRAVKRQTPGSISFVPSVAGLLLAGEVVRDLLKLDGDGKTMYN